MTGTPTARFCSACGAQREGPARFCSVCGAEYHDHAPAVVNSAEPPPLRRTISSAAGNSSWAVAVGGTLPDPSGFFPIVSETQAGAAVPTVPATQATSPRGKVMWGSALWMAITQGADMITRAIASGTPGDPMLPMRLGIAAAVVVFSVMLGSLPRLRSLFVRAGTIGMAILQGQGLMPVLQQAAMDPSLIGTFAPNLAAQAAGFLALLKLFFAVGKRADDRS